MALQYLLFGQHAIEHDEPNLLEKSIVDCVNSLSRVQINEELAKADKNYEEKIDKMTLSISYTRSDCKELNINYNDIRGDDIRKIRLAAWYTLKEN